MLASSTNDAGYLIGTATNEFTTTQQFDVGLNVGGTIGISGGGIGMGLEPLQFLKVGQGAWAEQINPDGTLNFGMFGGYGPTQVEFTKDNNILVGGNTVLTAPAAAAIYVPLSQVGANNGVAPLDAGGKVPLANLPANLLQYQGQWNPTTNTPALVNGTGTTGQVYEASTGGSHNFGAGSLTFLQGDFIIYNGSTWEQSQGVDRVTSVNSQQGIVVLNTDDVGEGSTNLYFTTARAIAAGASIYQPLEDQRVSSTSSRRSRPYQSAHCYHPIFFRCRVRCQAKGWRLIRIIVPPDTMRLT